MTELKRPHDDDIPTFDDPADLVNAVITTLQDPEEKTNIAMNYANDKNLATEVQAYAKIAGRDWTFYVKALAVSIGRNTDANPGAASYAQPTVDIDLGPAKVVSRQHAAIAYNIDLRCWELKVLGRNGARIDGVKTPVGAEHATPLHSGAILDIGGTQMMFILPDAPPSILQKMLNICLARYKLEAHKLPRTSSGSMMLNAPPQGSQFQGISSFQMFDKAHLAHSPSSVSAVSLQNNLDQDLSREEAKDIKPPYSYATMITQAILSNPDGVMSLSEIYNWISTRYAYYKYSKTGWQNSIRHNLSLNKAFEKVPRRPNEPGKGMKWQISESYKSDFMKKIQNGTLLKSRRGSSVSRTLQIHLATHQGLPESKTYYEPDAQRKEAFDHNHSNLQSMDNNPNIIQKVNHPMPYTRLPVNHMQHGYNGQQMPPNGYPMGYGAAPYQQLPAIYGQQHLQQPHLVPAHGDEKNLDLATPLRNVSTAENNTPKLPKMSNGMYMQNAGGLVPSQNTNVYKAPQSQPKESTTDNGAQNSMENTSNHGNSSESMQNSTAPTTSNTSELGLGFTSPKKIAALEAFTPERGTNAGGAGGKSSGSNVHQSSPAFWNFVQFSTPNGQTPGRKNSDDSNGQNSPTLQRRPSPRQGKSKGSPSNLGSSHENLPGHSPSSNK